MQYYASFRSDERDRPTVSLIAGEILDQPNAWSRAAELARAMPDALPTGERIAVIGCGSSWHAAKAIAALRELGGHGETDAFAASEALLDRSYHRVVAISRSGATTEIRRALERVPAGVATVAIVGDPHSHVAAACGTIVDLSFADDRSVVQTRFVTTTVCFARASLGIEVDGLLADADRALSAPHPIDPVTLAHAVVLGREWRVGLADAAALSLREAARVTAESHPAMEYRHGPIASTGPGSVVWMLDEPPAKLADEAAATGATVISAEHDPLAELIRIQRLAVAVAERRALDPDRPTNLERAVVLDAIESGGTT
jgi:fructoselysine-6-P-deglycase FrlB-like protein